MPNTELHDLVASLGAVYWQDPMVTDGYVLSGGVGPALTHIVNLIDSVQVAKIGSDTIVLDTMCSQPCFTYNPQPASGSGNPAIRRASYTAVTGCLQNAWTLFAVTDDAIALVYSWDGTTISGTDSIVRATIGTSGGNLVAQLQRQWGDGSVNQIKQVTGISPTHHVFEFLVNDATWEIVVDGSSVGSGAWTAGTWNTTTTTFQSGAESIGPDSSSADHRVGQMALFPSILSSSDRALVRAAMTLAMCSGHPTGDNPIWASTDF